MQLLLADLMVVLISFVRSRILKDLPLLCLRTARTGVGTLELRADPCGRVRVGYGLGVLSDGLVGRCSSSEGEAPIWPGSSTLHSPGDIATPQIANTNFLNPW
jgi:hypothetical protein